MSNPYYPGGSQQPPNPYQQGGQGQGGSYSNQPYSAPQQFGAPGQYGNPQHYGAPQQYGAPGHYGAPQNFAAAPQHRPRSGGGTASAFATLLLLGCAGLSAFIAYAGRDGGPASELRSRAVQATLGVAFLGDHSTLDDVKNLVNLTWVLAAVTALLAILVVTVRSSAVGGLAGTVAILVTAHYAATLVKMNDNLGEYSQYLSNSDLWDYYMWPAIALVAWLLAAIFSFAAAAGRRRRV